LQEIEKLLRVSCYLYFGKAEDLSYGRLMGFNKEISEDTLKLLKQTIQAIRQHNQPGLLHNVGKTGHNWLTVPLFKKGWP
jgi:hypothetical protein